MAVWIACLALLASTLPAYACAASMHVEDCCPDTAPMPCGNDGQGISTDTAAGACCIQIPEPAQASAPSAVRVALGDDSASDPPQSPVPAARDLAVGRVVASCASTTLPVALPNADLSPVYLRTGRLRL